MTKPLHNRILSIIDTKRQEAQREYRSALKTRSPEYVKVGNRIFRADWAERFWELHELLLKEIMRKSQEEVSLEPKGSLERAKLGPQLDKLEALVSKYFSGALKGLGTKITPLDGAILILEDIGEKLASGEKDEDGKK